MRRRHRKFFVAGLAIIILVSVAILSAWISSGLYDRLTMSLPDCAGNYSGNTPASFDASSIDTAPYLMPEYSEVRFASRDPNITIDAWWVPGARPDARP